LNVETPYYELGFGGVQIEDTLVVTREGCRALTKAGKELFVV
jgi:Xaa-Pro aminopeptidase